MALSPTTSTAAGLFTERDPISHPAFPVRVQRSNYDAQWFAYSPSFQFEIEDSPLMSRGWVVQEHLLSPRPLYFGEQLHWECAESLACETFLDQVPEQLMGNVLGWTIPYRITTLLGKVDKMTQNDRAVPGKVYRSWLGVVKWFSECKLSFEHDFLPALSGLVQRFGETLDDECHAGLWGKDMVYGLLWCTTCPPEQVPASGRYLKNIEVYPQSKVDEDLTDES
jgi:hypothetical protein